MTIPTARAPHIRSFSPSSSKGASATTSKGASLPISKGVASASQAAATKLTKTDLSQLLDYLSTYANDGILCRSSAMIFSAHSNAAYLNISRACSRASAHIMLSKNTPVPSLNGPVFTIAQIIKNVMCLSR